MSFIRRLNVVSLTRLLGPAGRAASAALMLLAALALPGAAPIMAAPVLDAPAAVAPLTPQTCGVNATLVTNGSDGEANSLRAAVGCATAGQTVTIDPIMMNNTLYVTSTEIAVTVPITIDGSLATGAKVEALNHNRVFNITAGGTVNLKGLVLQDGQVAGNGGAVLDTSSFPLVLNQVQVLSSTASGIGGGLWASTATLINTQFISNTSGSHAGGVWVDFGNTMVTGGRFERNTCTGSGCQGGGLNVYGLTLTGTVFINNTSPGQGGGAWAFDSATLTNAQFQNNKCTDSACQGGGLYANTTLTLTGTDFIGNTSVDHGGGAFAMLGATLTNGQFQDNQCTGLNCQGGGLFGADSVTLTGTQFISNSVLGQGGGMSAQSAAALMNGLFQGNQCRQGGCRGGGLYSADTLILSATDFISNTSITYAGGAWVNGDAVLTGGSFQGNRCTGPACQGGGLVVGTLTLNGTQFISNTSGSKGGAMVLGTAAVTNGRFERNACAQAGCLGGGLDVELSASVLNSSFTGNQSAGNGGGIGLVSGAQLTLANVSLSGNMATTAGGGLMANSATHTSLFNVTVADNQAPSGGGVWVNPAANVGISNTILSNNGFANCSGPIVSGTHNLEWPGSDCAAASPGAGFTTADPLLAPLALNPPGTTLTRALGPGSPARDAGDAATCAAAPVNNVDQRGVARPIRGLPGPGPAVCDLGAFEAGPPVWLMFLPLAGK